MSADFFTRAVLSLIVIGLTVKIAMIAGLILGVGLAIKWFWSD